MLDFIYLLFLGKEKTAFFLLNFYSLSNCDVITIYLSKNFGHILKHLFTRIKKKKNLLGEKKKKNIIDGV